MTNNRESTDTIWATDGIVSLPVARTTMADETIDMEGFVFTPLGIRVNVSESDREEILRSGYSPTPKGEIYGDD